MSIAKDGYREKISTLISDLERRAGLGIDPDVQVSGRVPTNATSEFLTNKEQGDWAERLILSVINKSEQWVATPYGVQDGRSAGDDGFDEYYRRYQEELNSIGKKPDILVFKKSDLEGLDVEDSDQAPVEKAIAAFEVRSSSFLERKYREHMDRRTAEALKDCHAIRAEILSGPLEGVLKEKSPEIFRMILGATDATFRELSFRKPSWSATAELRQLSEKLGVLRNAIAVLQKRDFLSITPKVEDVALVNRWVQRFGVRHFYVQVFFDSAYAISFENILKTAIDDKLEDVKFSIERDAKNQGKTTIKVSVDAASCVVSEISEPSHKSARKELTRGRLLYFVQFEGGEASLDQQTFERLVNEG